MSAEITAELGFDITAYDCLTGIFDSTPSIRPVFGPINSRFGWRIHPIKKGKRFHKGIDIKTYKYMLDVFWFGAGNLEAHPCDKHTTSTCLIYF